MVSSLDGFCMWKSSIMSVGSCRKTNQNKNPKRWLTRWQTAATGQRAASDTFTWSVQWGFVTSKWMWVTLKGAYLFEVIIITQTEGFCWYQEETQYYFAKLTYWFDISDDAAWCWFKNCTWQQIWMNFHWAVSFIMTCLWKCSLHA